MGEHGGLLLLSACEEAVHADEYYTEDGDCVIRVENKLWGFAVTSVLHMCNDAFPSRSIAAFSCAMDPHSATCSACLRAVMIRRHQGQMTRTQSFFPGTLQRSLSLCVGLYVLCELIFSFYQLSCSVNSHFPDPMKYFELASIPRPPILHDYSA